MGSKVGDRVGLEVEGLRVETFLREVGKWEGALEGRLERLLLR